MIRSAVRLLPAVAPAIASVLFASGSAHAQQSPGSHAAAWEESGEASWYGGRHNGRRTSSGTIFNENDMTAAHATLPLGTKVRVTMQDTGQSVVVTITDRQPPKYVRVIDLSKGAASRIGLLNRGTAMVTLQPARPDETEEVAEAPVNAGYEGTLDRPIRGTTAPRRRTVTRARQPARITPIARHPAHPSTVLPDRRSTRHPAAQRRL
jgi:rare lipoprotein A (peptidoglycan hydrolase)